MITETELSSIPIPVVIIFLQSRCHPWSVTDHFQHGFHFSLRPPELFSDPRPRYQIPDQVYHSGINYTNLLRHKRSQRQKIVIIKCTVYVPADWNLKSFTAYHFIYVYRYKYLFLCTILSSLLYKECKITERTYRGSEIVTAAYIDVLPKWYCSHKPPPLRKRILSFTILIIEIIKIVQCRYQAV